MLDWKSEHGQIEAQANTFASFLLMPLDDFREQIRSQAITMALMRHLSDRYEVSITAAILKWLGITDKRAMIVVSKDGFIDWAWGSKRLFKSGIYDLLLRWAGNCAVAGAFSCRSARSINRR